MDAYSFGDYFSWGNVEGHNEGSGYIFNSANYANTPAYSISTNLNDDQDAAQMILGGNWRMPTAAQFAELNGNCTSEIETREGVVGRIFTSNINGAKIFLPAAGYYSGAILVGKNAEGTYWSRDFVSQTNAKSMDFGRNSVNPGYSNPRYVGFQIRPIIVQE